MVLKAESMRFREQGASARRLPEQLLHGANQLPAERPAFCKSVSVADSQACNTV